MSDDNVIDMFEGTENLWHCACMSDTFIIVKDEGVVCTECDAIQGNLTVVVIDNE